MMVDAQGGGGGRLPGLVSPDGVRLASNLILPFAMILGLHPGSLGIHFFDIIWCAADQFRGDKPAVVISRVVRNRKPDEK